MIISLRSHAPSDLHCRFLDPHRRIDPDVRQSDPRALQRGEGGDNPWGGATLEWKIPSPPPVENFEKIPVVDRGPYDFEEQEHYE